MINYQKKPLLVLTKEPVFIRRGATSKHNEVTVVTVSYAIPVSSLFPVGALEMSPLLVNNVSNIVRSDFQDIHFDFNRSQGCPAFTFTVKAKTERRGEDSPNQELADKIALAKANMKAANVLRHIITGNNRQGGLIDYYTATASNFADIHTRIEEFVQREDKYIKAL